MSEPTDRDAYLPAATGLRGIAAGWVLLYHAWQFAGAPRLAVAGIDLTPLFATGYFGVDLFFVLSGFLLGLPFVAAAQGGEAVALGRFWRQRLRRVLPAYWTQLLILLLVAVVQAGTVPAPLDAAGHALLLFNLAGNDSAINPVYWSLPVEWDFYLLLPLLALAFRGGRRALLGAALLVALAIGFRLGCVAALHAWGADGIPLYRWIIQLPGRLDQFVAGMLAAWWFLRGGPRRGALLAWAGLLLVLAVSWRVAALGDFIVGVKTPWLYLHYSLVGAGFAALLLGAVAAPAQGLARVLAARPLAWLGMVSYSLYLWHYPLLQAQQAWRPAGLGTAAGVGLAVPVILLAAWLSYRFVERPFLGVRARRAERQVQSASG